ncbi:MAG TPA: hypothetical protein PLA77_10785 [Bacteroidales bacterium]|nr:hypothetical protein [Bacteroidales bacterium]
MKHNTHIYLAYKAIEFLYEGSSNIIDSKTGNAIIEKRKKALRITAKELQRMLMHYIEFIDEATWAPDDIINDKAIYHTFKLFTDQEFPGSRSFAKEVHFEKYYRASGGGGLPYKVDHLARVISDMIKLRLYNDRFSMNQIMYQYLLISHYIVDANVPMHCDLRDDPPEASDTTKPLNGNYFKESLHGNVEQLWDDAVTPVAVSEEIIKPSRTSDKPVKTELSEAIVFDIFNPAHIGLIKPELIAENDLMEFMLKKCVNTKEKSLILFPFDKPEEWGNESMNRVKAETRQIFAGAIADLISVWLWIWMKNNKTGKEE